MEKLSAPPGFVSRTSFVLKKIQCDDEISCSTTLRRDSKRALKREATEITADIVALKRTLGSRPWILYDQSTNLKKSKCEKCTVETVRHFPKDLKTEVLEEAPVFYPTEEEFSNILEYMTRIRQQAEAHGICRIVPPSSWKPPCHLECKAIWESSTFATRVQLFGEIQNQNRDQKTKKAKGDGAKSVRMANEVGYCRIEHGPEFTLEKFKIYVDNFKDQYFRRKDKLSDSSRSSIFKKPSELSVTDIESEYMQLVNNPHLEVGVLCGDDLDSRSFCSGFPSVSDSEKSHESEKYLESGWNLINTPKLPGYLFSLEDCNASSVSASRVRVGMCFSSEFWKVERHHLYSLSYVHLGAQRVWYVAPGRYYFKFEAIMRNLFPDFSVEKPKLLQKTVPILSPFAFKAEGIPIRRCIQNPGEFTIIFPGSHYSGFDCGFNCSEIVNFAPPDWLPHGHISAELHQEKQINMLISYDKMLLETAKEAVKAQLESSLSRKKTANILKRKYATGKDGVLTKTFKARIRLEENKRDYLSNPSHSLPMDKDFDAKVKRECCICFCDLHFSAVRCPCSADRYSCLNHAKQMCSCSWADKIFLFRHTIDELNLLREALEGKLSAVYRWGNVSPFSIVPKESETKSSLPEEPDKKKDILMDGAVSNGIKDVTVASIKAEVKGRLQVKAAKDMTKVNHKRVESRGEIEEKYITPEMKKQKRSILRVSEPADGDEGDHADDEEDVNDDDYNDDDDTNDGDDGVDDGVDDDVEDDDDDGDGDSIPRQKTNTGHRSRRTAPVIRQFRFPACASNDVAYVLNRQE